ncbi:MAG: mechanosensitive ion channel protein MscS [Flavobacteriales bacterium]|jgi:MscS family membrane protein|nr:mechanosensitive ion channel protein MscS [Flavobacteriales bacterium]|tara:strand:+ start:23649 stop:24734 length:1086 start_codon:yes stop_codon:yes gene_type:complete
MNITNFQFLDNSGSEWITFISIILLSFLIRKFISKRIIIGITKIFNKQNNNLNTYLNKPINNIIFMVFLYIAFNQLEYPNQWNLVDANEFGVKMIMNRGYALIIALFIIQLFLKSTDLLGEILKNKASQTKSKLDDQLIPFAIDSIKIITIIIGVLVIIGNIFNVNVTALAAGLGVGGIAIAMASKESLENLLGSFTIFLDRPFIVGDIVTVGTITGVVEKVGFRSTRLRTFDKSLVTVPNKKMVDAELDNLGMRPVRRAKFNLGLTYDTTKDQIKNIVKDIQNMINEHPMTNDDGRVRFMNFNDSSLDIMIVFFVNSSNWDDFINTKEDINFKIMDIIEKHNCSFAFPSTSIYIEKNSKQ